MADLATSATHENLRTAFAAVAQASQRYLHLAQHADIEGFPEVATALRTTADSKTGHAFGLLDHLADVGDTADNLRAAKAAEEQDATGRSTAFAQAARDEGFGAIAEWFEAMARAEAAHAQRFAALLSDLTGS